MGSISKGILGGFCGKVGTVIGYIHNGMACMRSLPTSVFNPRTQAQLEQRARFSTAIAFLQPLTEFVKIGFRNASTKMSAFNSAMSYTMKNAIRGLYPDFSIDYANALLSRGTLAGALNPNALSVAAGQVTFSWDDNSGELNGEATDAALIVAYNPTRNEAVFTNGESARVDGTQTLAVPTSYSGDTLECYIAFMDAKGRMATSKYAGPVVVA
jgi:hypothetical protein